MTVRVWELPLLSVEDSVWVVCQRCTKASIGSPSLKPRTTLSVRWAEPAVVRPNFATRLSSWPTSVQSGRPWNENEGGPGSGPRSMKGEKTPHGDLRRVEPFRPGVETGE